MSNLASPESKSHCCSILRMQIVKVLQKPCYPYIVSSSEIPIPIKPSMDFLKNLAKGNRSSIENSAFFHLSVGMFKNSFRCLNDEILSPSKIQQITEGEANLSKNSYPPQN